MGSGLTKKKGVIKTFSSNQHFDEEEENLPLNNRKTKRYSLFGNENTIVEKTPSPIIKKKQQNDSQNSLSSSDSSLSCSNEKSLESSKEQRNISMSPANSISERKSQQSSNFDEVEKNEFVSEEIFQKNKDFIDYLGNEPTSYHGFYTPKNDNPEDSQVYPNFNKSQLKKKIVISSQLPETKKDSGKEEETNDEKRFIMQIADYSVTNYNPSENQENHRKSPGKFFFNNVNLIERENFYELGLNVISRKGSLVEIPNQDDYFIFISQNLKIYSVFDGHGPDGHLISNLCYNLLMKRLLEDPLLLEDTTACLKNSFSKLYDDLKQHINRTHPQEKGKINMKFSGTTTTVILQREKTLYIAHLGDSRAVIGKKQKNKKFPYQITTDHVPTLPQEKKRIYQNGGEVRKLNSDYVEKVFVRGRIYPGLSVSRSIGDEVGAFIGVIDEPEINVYEINEQTDQFLLLGTKAVFNYLEDYEIINILSSFSSKSVKMASDFLYKRVKSAWIQNENGFDDITLILVYF